MPSCHVVFSEVVTHDSWLWEVKGTGIVTVYPVT